MSASMAEVIEAHTAEWTIPNYLHYVCLCKEARWHANTSADYYQAHAQHVAEVLADAGYGKLEEAWDEGYRRAKSDHCDNSPSAEYCDIESDNPYRKEA